MGNEENKEGQLAQLSYVSFVYDMCLALDRLQTILADFREDDHLTFPDLHEEALDRVIGFIDRRLVERGVYVGQVHSPEDIPSDKPSKKKAMGT